MVHVSDGPVVDVAAREDCEVERSRKRRMPWPTAVAVIGMISAAMWALIWLCLRLVLQV